jgi:NADPH:quinone reductase-like Zn-dependent oxidoreductase
MDIGTQVLELEKINLHAAGNQGLDLPFDAIILDCGTSSLLCERSPETWMDPVKTLLENVRNLLWVSSQLHDLPYAGASGAFIRTIASEHPQIKAASLTIKGGVSARIMESVVLPIMQAMQAGSDEVELAYEDGIISILRYLPDDALSAHVGASKPRRSSAPLTSVNHQVRISAPSTVSVYPIRFHDFPPDDLISVDVELSVVDLNDAQRLFSQSPGDSPLGCYFAGKTWRSGAWTSVVGHCAGSHAKKIRVPSGTLFDVPTGISLNQALHQFTVHATAMTILQTVIRVHAQESIYLGWNSPDVAMFRQACELLGCNVVRDQADADFAIEFSRITGGYIVNGNPVRRQTPGPSSTFGLAHRIWSLVLPELPEFGLDDVQQAFNFVTTNKGLAAINHRTVDTSFSQVITHTETPALFRKDSAYVIIGGFGGLGCHVMQWMVQRGARHLVVISRSGATSDAARRAIRTIEAMGGDVTALQTNASDSVAVTGALEPIRASRRIRGCLNMAIVLQNSPFLTMQPDQWNAGIRTKIDTTKSLHLATMKDDLDFFIMFSSVSSIAGNRAQAAYAAGNAFQNAMAAYRRRLGMTAVSVALGAVEEIGTLAEDTRTLSTLTQSGLRILNSSEVLCCVEAAVYESQHSQRHLLVTGFDMFATVNNVIQATPEQNLIFWANSAEFSHFFDHRASDECHKAEASLLDQIRSSDDETAHAKLRTAFLQFLAGVLGYSAEKLDSWQPIAAYGVDSLNAVACRFWFHKGKIFQPL